jgi:O-antigen ligase
MSILLHQSNEVFGVNVSFADFFCTIIFMVFVYKKQLLIPVTPLMFFFIVSIVVLVTAVFYIPFKFMYYPNPIRIINDYIKLLAIFMYFIIGYNLSNLYFLEKTLKWYSLFGLLVGAAGVLLTFTNIHVFSQILFFGDTRFRGLMNDPNYFSVLHISALVYISRSKTIKARYKFLAFLITFLSVITTGSKTGIITLICYLTLRLIEYLFTSKKKLSVVVTQLFLVIIIVLITPITFNLIQNVLNQAAASIPSFARIHFLFTDFIDAISVSGSGRDATWKVALKVIQLSPLIGIGIGTYSNIASELFQFNNIAHNTFLQLSAEWGFPLTVVLFSYLFFTLGKVTISRIPNSETNLMLRDIILILLIGSMAISLNNARVLWLFMGALVSSIDRNKVGKITKNYVD